MSADTVHLTWDAPAGETGITGYFAWVLPGTDPQSDNGLVTCGTLDAGARECTMTVPAGTAYTASVVALNPDRGDWGTVVTDVVPALTAPATVPTGGGTLSTPSGAASALAQGGTVTLTGTGYAPNSTVSLYIYSTPTLLGTVQTDGTGSFSKVVTVPANLAPGAHHLVSAGVDPSGNLRYLTSAVTVAQATGTAGLDRLRDAAAARRRPRGCRGCRSGARRPAAPHRLIHQLHRSGEGAGSPWVPPPSSWVGSGAGARSAVDGDRVERQVRLDPREDDEQQQRDDGEHQDSDSERLEPRAAGEVAPDPAVHGGPLSAGRGGTVSAAQRRRAVGLVGLADARAVELRVDDQALAGGEPRMAGGQGQVGAARRRRRRAASGVGRSPRRRSGGRPPDPGCRSGRRRSRRSPDRRAPGRRTSSARLDDDRVARPELVQLEEGRALAHPVPGEGDVALLARQRRPDVVARPLGQLVLAGALDDHAPVVGPQPRDVQDRERAGPPRRSAAGRRARVRALHVVQDWSSWVCACALSRSVTNSS